MSETPDQPADNQPQPEPQPDDATTSEPNADEEALGDPGKRAITAERRARAKAEKDAAALRAELDKLREAQQTDQEKALAAARREGAKEATAEWRTKWRTERLQTEALRAMAGRVSDPRLALPHLKLDDEVMDDDGNVKRESLEAAVEELLDLFPSLATGTAPTHHADLGPKRTARVQQPGDMNALLRQAAGRR